MGSKIKIAISTDFLKSFSQIPQKQQTKVREFVEKFRSNPTSAAINYEKIKQARDSKLHSVRIDQDYRGIVLKPEVGDVYLLLWVDHHDKAYKWAESRIFSIHPETGSLQVVEVQSQEISLVGHKEKIRDKGLFSQFRDKDLLRFGVPEILLPLARSLKTEDDLDKAAHRLPQEAYEALFLLAAGYSMQEVFREMGRHETPGEVVPTEGEAKTIPMSPDKQDLETPRKVDPTDFITALDNPDTKRRFYVVEDALELAEILKAPLEQWRVFLHPSQRKVVEMNANGPVRVLGGAGTGKTVAALHRAKWLAQHVFTGENDRILFTTFTKNLAADIRENLRKIGSIEILKKIEVVNLDAWVSQFLKRHGYEYTLIFDDDTGPYWENALNQAPSDLELDPSFYRDEWENVIQAQAISSSEEYLKAPRIGRRKRLNRTQRQKIWPVFEEYRAQLNENGLKEMIDATRDARIILQNKGDILPYKTIIVDEAQDMGTEAFKLIRQMIPGTRSDRKNDIFIVGDAHQRIYRHKVVLSQCGIDVRGRSRKLRINYRTTEETRRWAIRLLEGRHIDDLDGGQDDQKGYKSLLHGIPPEVKNFKSFHEEVKFILEYLNKLNEEKVPLNTVCLVARTGDLLTQYEGALKSAGLQTYLIKRSVAEDRNIPGLRVATMHRVKGLEFDYMVIAGVNDEIVPLEQAAVGYDDPLSQQESEVRERALLYVSATRAKREVLITGHGNKSRFL